ncbi:MAG: hypothetical protein V3T72_22910 [Thermoanaerobaculia bacterium]
MPSHEECTCVPRPIRDVQKLCFFIQLDLQMLEDRMIAARQEIALPENRDAIWNGDAPPTVEIEVYGALSVITDDHLPELIALLHRAAIATPRRVTMAWNRLRSGKRTTLEAGHSRGSDRRGTGSRSGTGEPPPEPLLTD